ncbi:MAG: TAT-variant-translocated molybdopterin oxidoreductase [Acidobacteriota bacterium]|nr:TAT-variant-translocated molybdopterin oxidoreductase [Acidobacteriota bacterium]
MSERGSGERYWRSLEDLGDDPRFAEIAAREFPSLLPELADPRTRRTFLKLMGASMALAGLTACRWPEERILPFAKRPEGRVPGTPERYATAMELGGVARGLLVTSYDGRPIKIEGNPDHPGSAGATDSIAQAAILELFDPDRSRHPSQRVGGAHERRERADYESHIKGRIAALAGRGRGLAVLGEASSSPSLARMQGRLLRRFPALRWYEYEPVTRDNERLGADIALGAPLRTHLDLSSADVIVAFDADLLTGHPDALRHAREFAARRRADDGAMNRLHAVESAFSVTGAMADHRHAASSAAVAAFAGQLAAFVLGPLGELPRGLAQALARTEGRATAPFVEELADELRAHRGRGVVVAGPGQPPEVHALVHLMNDRLGNVNRTVHYTEDPGPTRPSHEAAIGELAEAIRSGEVETLVILGGNPVFDAPADVDFAGALGRLADSVHLSLYRNETSNACAWHVPRAHFLETWGDARAWDGTISIVQPLIEPLWGGVSPIELLSLLGDGEPAPGHDLVRETARGYLGRGGFESAWASALHDGLVEGSRLPRLPARPDPSRVARRVADWWPPVTPSETAGLEIVFLPDPKLHDGRFANNGWLQELPEPMTKMAWDNALLVGKATADEHGLRSHETAVVSVGEREIEAPVFVMPGQADGSLAIWLGQGRSVCGRVGDGVGADAYRLRTSGAMHRAVGASVRPTGKRHELATTQDHFAIDLLGLEETQRRRPELLREATLGEYREHPDFVRHRAHTPELHELWKPVEYDGYKWGMSIDLTACTGCSACVVACQAENNIPVVGKVEVIKGREMHWIRVDRYFKGEPDAPEVAFQPVTCHHCENAPCEQVCPVAATLHSEEGLNQMVYNRCIGTRYCSNNCPYKVRRFNFWNNQKATTDLEALRHNPEVTVRSRGVMEKCSYCVQRIEAARTLAKREDRRIADGDVTPACAQACPTQAIVFGDLNDRGSRVARAHASQRSYAMLEELKVKPRTRYLAKLRNPATDGGGDEHGGHA